MSTNNNPVEGRVNPGIEPVRAAFLDNFTRRHELGGACCVYHHGEQGDYTLVADLDRLAVVLARQRPAWPPGERQAYHAITLGYYESELLRRIDPQHRSLGRFFHDEIAAPLGIDFYIRLPPSIPNARLAILDRPGLLASFIE